MLYLNWQLTLLTLPEGDEHDRTRDRPEVAGEVRRVGGRPAQQVGRSDHREALVLHLLGDGRPGVVVAGDDHDRTPAGGGFDEDVPPAFHLEPPHPCAARHREDVADCVVARKVLLGHLTHEGHRTIRRALSR